MHSYVIKIVVLTFLMFVCVSTRPTEPINPVTPSEPSIEAPTEIPTEPPTEIVEPTYELIDIPPMIDLPEIESFKTIYDIEDAITKCDVAICEYDQILVELPAEHPQYGELIMAMTNLMNVSDEYRAVLNAHWESRMERRPVMTHVWRALKNHGWSDAVAAGIVGNMCAETGGMGYQDIEWDIYAYDSHGNKYYGLCMWALRYTPKSFRGSSLDEQLEYLYSNIKDQMDHVYDGGFRGKYGIRDLRYDDFVKIDNPYDAAIAFAVCYERCGPNSIPRRGTLAEKTYDYFINLNTWPWSEPY